MGAEKITEIVYKFPYGESHSYSVVAATDIPNLEDKKPGLYAWYIRVLPKETAVNDLVWYGSFFGSKKYSAQLSAALGEKYVGDLSRQPAFDATMPANMALVSTVTTVFSPPIYIGIAKNVRSRLLTHLAKLREALITPFILEISGDLNADSDEESSFFGGRVGDLLRAQGIDDVRHLFVKIVFQPVDDLAQRKAVEHFANRVYFPFCGRR
jgi:hypothetical protein